MSFLNLFVSINIASWHMVARISQRLRRSFRLQAAQSRRSSTIVLYRGQSKMDVTPRNVTHAVPDLALHVPLSALYLNLRASPIRRPLSLSSPRTWRSHQQAMKMGSLLLRGLGWRVDTIPTLMSRTEKRPQPEACVSRRFPHAVVMQSSLSRFLPSRWVQCAGMKRLLTTIRSAAWVDASADFHKAPAKR